MMVLGKDGLKIYNLWILIFATKVTIENNNYRVYNKSHPDATTTTRRHPNGACDLGKLQTLVTKETIIKPQNDHI